MTARSELMKDAPATLRGCERISWLQRDAFRVPLVLPLFVTRRGQSIQHWQSQWHTERNGQHDTGNTTRTTYCFTSPSSLFASANAEKRSFAERTATYRATEMEPQTCHSKPTIPALANEHGNCCGDHRRRRSVPYSPSTACGTPS